MILDNVCLESLSIDLTRPMLDSAARSVNRLGDKIDESVLLGYRTVALGPNETLHIESNQQMPLAY